MKIINLFGGAGAGKSTTRAGLFNILKKHNINCEEAIEWVKQKVYEKNDYVFKDQLLVYANQRAILEQFKQCGVEWVISDSPILLSNIYNKNKTSDTFKKMVLEDFKRYNNINIFIKRTKPYTEQGRLQTEDEAKKIDDEILDLLKSNDIPFYTVEYSEELNETEFEIIKLIEREQWNNNLNKLSKELCEQFTQYYPDGLYNTK